MNYVDEIILRVRISKKYRKILFFFFDLFFNKKSSPKLCYEQNILYMYIYMSLFVSWNNLKLRDVKES